MDKPSLAHIQIPHLARCLIFSEKKKVKKGAQNEPAYVQKMSLSQNELYPPMGQVEPPTS